jgi:low affinity Fe/Cu permease
MEKEIKRLLKKPYAPLLITLGVAILILWLLGGVLFHLLRFLLIVLGTTALVIFTSIFIQNYGRYNDAEKALKKTIEEMKKLYYALLDLVLRRG